MILLSLHAWLVREECIMFIFHYIELYLSKIADSEITVSNNDWKKWLEKTSLTGKVIDISVNQ